ncbi:unnamed protein product [marine sediment metagenome]|uniref:Uncharacterized protein n=1 Tax=marine sediment metagenome TaxID=412755 RepID=X1SBI8_9ZZZZ
MSFLSLDVKELRERWMKIYLNLFMLKSHNPEIFKHLADFKEPLALFNDNLSFEVFFTVWTFNNFCHFSLSPYV